MFELGYFRNVGGLTYEGHGGVKPIVLTSFFIVYTDQGGSRRGRGKPRNDRQNAKGDRGVG